MVQAYETNPPRRPAPAVERAVQMLKALASESGGQRMSDLCRALGINKSTAHQILQVLEAHGLVEREPDSLRYRLGYGILELGSAALGRLDLRTVARPVLRDLARRTGETVFLGVREGDRIVIVDKEESPADLKITSPVGRRLPLTAGSFGKVFLAYASQPHLDRLLSSSENRGAGARGELRRFTARTITDPRAYREELERARQRGWALDDEEYLDGVRGISAPILGHGRELVAALAVVGFASSMTDQRLDKMIEATVLAAATIATRLGGSLNGPSSNGHERDIDCTPTAIPGRSPDKRTEHRV